MNNGKKRRIIGKTKDESITQTSNPTMFRFRYFLDLTEGHSFGHPKTTYGGSRQNSTSKQAHEMKLSLPRKNNHLVSNEPYNSGFRHRINNHVKSPRFHG